MIHHRKVRLGALALCATTTLGLAGAAPANMIKMPTSLRAVQEREANAANGTPLDPGVTPPAPPCPENGQLNYSVDVPNVGSIGPSNCGLPEFPGIGTPTPGNMAYWGGKVQTHPKVYLVFWGWGKTDAFPNTDCAPTTITEGAMSEPIGCDADGAAQYMADFVKQMGGTKWAGVSTQFFQTNADGSKSFVSNDQDVLGGIWSDDQMPDNFNATSGDNPAGPTNTYTLMAAEAQRAAEHFGVSGADLINADFVIAQPPGYTDPNALKIGYCAFHDYTQPVVENHIYDSVTPGLVYTNMPYSLSINYDGDPTLNVCGENAVNRGPDGMLDGFSIGLGHEIEEAITDPGAEEILGGNGITDQQTILGGWYDPFDANENGDKCAWVGVDPTDEQGTEPVPGAEGDLTGNAGGKFAVQSLWSNNSAGGAGYCAGGYGTDLPGPLAGGEGGGIAKSAARSR